MPNASQKGYRLHIQNFLSIDELDLDLSPGIQGFVGKNAAGKTNILTAVESILSGKHDTKLIKDGEKRSEVRLEEIDENGDVLASVARIQTQQANRLQGSGATSTSPKKWLTSLMDEIAINPMRLISEDPVQYLKDHLPIKIEESELEEIGDYDLHFDLTANAFDECDKAKDQIHVDRLAQYKLMRHAAEVIDEIKKDLPPLPEDAPPFNEDDLDNKRTELKAQLMTLEEHNEDRKKIQTRINNADIDIETFDQQVNHLRTKYADLEPSRVAIKDERNETISELKRAYEQSLVEAEKKYATSLSAIEQEAVELKEKAESKKELIKQSMANLADLKGDLEAKPIRSTSDINLALADNQANIEKLARHLEVSKRYDRVREKEAEHEDLEERYKEFDGLYKYYAYNLPKKLIDRANLPVPGLEFREQQLYVEGRHIDRLSTSERHLVAVDLAVALAKLKGHIAVVIDGIEVLDEDSRIKFLNAIQDKGIRIIYTRHGDPLYPHETKLERREGVDERHIE